MPVPPVILACIPLALLCYLAQRRHPDAAPRSGRLAGLARIGYGGVKAVVLAPALERLVTAATGALPVSQSSTQAWFGVVAFAVQFYLAWSAVADLVAGGFQFVSRRRPVEWLGTPFWEGAVTGFWRAWAQPLSIGEKQFGTRIRGPQVEAARALGSLLLVAFTVGIWRGFSWGHGLWVAIHAALLALEFWRGKSLFSPLPLPVRAAILQVLFIATCPLLFTQGPASSWWLLSRLWESSPETAYSLLLDARLTTPWPMLCFWLGWLCCVALPPAGWLLNLPHRLWRVIGLLALLLAFVMLPCLGTPPAAGTFRGALLHQVRRPLSAWFREGNDAVFVGIDGWLFPQADLNRLSLRGFDGGTYSASLNLARELGGQGIPLLVVVMPDKVAMHPEQILPGEYAGPVQPVALPGQLQQLRAAGAEVLDLAPLLWNLRETFDAYPRQDDRWTPAAMKQAVLAVEKLVRSRWRRFVVERTPVIRPELIRQQRPGNLAALLYPHDPAGIWGEESFDLVALHGLADDSASPVLVLGGDLVSVYSEQTAGFVAQLAPLLGRPLAFAQWPGGAVDPKAHALVILIIRAGNL